MQNEKAIIVVLSYIIGLNTAFIGFGLNSNDQSAAYPAPYPIQIVSSKIDAESDEQEELTVGVQETHEGLFALIGNYDRVLSAQAINATEARHGFHESIIGSEVAPSGEFINYCAQLTNQTADCALYVFDVMKDITHKVMGSDAEQVTVAPGSKVWWSEGGLLHTDEYVSANSDEPWSVVDKLTE